MLAAAIERLGDAELTWNDGRRRIALGGDLLEALLDELEMRNVR